MTSTLKSPFQNKLDEMRNLNMVQYIPTRTQDFDFSIWVTIQK